MGNPIEIPLKDSDKDRSAIQKYVQIDINSLSVMKYSSICEPTNFTQLQHSTDLNVEPLKCLTSEVELNSIKYTSSDSHAFSSFQIAHMFPDYIGDGLDIISDAENIKCLFKIPHSSDSISMMVHRIENTLLIDEFDIDKHLILQTENDTWEWLRQYFYNNILQTVDRMEEPCITPENTDQRKLNSKFLRHSIAEPLIFLDNESQKDKLSNQSPLLFSFLPEPMREDMYPYNRETHKLFSRSFLWKFEGLQILLGTDLPIFKDTNNNSCLSLRLRDMSNVDANISRLTLIDYWLDNLMCNIPKVSMCHHINGIVQKYELVKTQDLPDLIEKSKFSTDTISFIAQNVIAFLKSNATKVGHTYWLFKEKNKDDIRLYDLTELSSESVDCKNPFTVPVSMLLYRVVRNSKHYLKDGKPLNPDSIKILLDICLKNLDKTKYPQIVTSIIYILSDLYIPHYKNPSPKDVHNMDQKPLILQINSHDNLSLASDYKDHISTIDKYHLCLMPEYINISKDPPTCSTSEHKIMMFYERCHETLSYVGKSLKHLKSIENQNSQLINDGTTMVNINQLLTMLSETTIAPIINNKKVVIKDSNNMYFKLNKKNIIKDNDNTKHINAETIPDFGVDQNNINWKQQLESLLWEKASICYTLLGIKEFTRSRHGIALRHFNRAYECQKCVTTKSMDYFIGNTLSWCGDCYLTIGSQWHCNALNYTNELKTNDLCGSEMIELLEKKFNNNIYRGITPNWQPSETMLLSYAEVCYNHSLKFQIVIFDDIDVVRRIFTFHSERTHLYTKQLRAVLRNPIILSSKVKNLLTEYQCNFLNGVEMLKKMNRKDLVSSMYLDIGYKYNKLSEDSDEYNFLNLAFDHIHKAMIILGNCSEHPNLWDSIKRLISKVTFTIAIDFALKADCGTKYEIENEILNKTWKALDFCELEHKDMKVRDDYLYRAGRLHGQIANVYLHRLRISQTLDTPKCKIYIKKCSSHYNESYEMFVKSDYQADCVTIILQIVEFYQVQIDHATTNNHRLKSYISTIKSLKKCSTHLQYFVDNNLDLVDNIRLDRMNSYTKSSIYMLLVRLEQKLQHILKCTIKMAMEKTSKLANNLDELKIIYGNLLRNNDVKRKLLHILEIITLLPDF